VIVDSGKNSLDSTCIDDFLRHSKDMEDELRPQRKVCCQSTNGSVDLGNEVNQGLTAGIGEGRAGIGCRSVVEFDRRVLFAVGARRQSGRAVLFHPIALSGSIIGCGIHTAGAK
jgi:hypothetical protein